MAAARCAILTVFVAVQLLQHASALKCYTCNSFSDPSCQLKDYKKNATSTNCDHSEDVCVKIITSVGNPSRAASGSAGNAVGFSVTSRLCGDSATLYKNLGHSACDKTGTGDGGYNEMCVCATNECNHASRTLVLSSLATLLIVATTVSCW